MRSSIVVLFTLLAAAGCVVPTGGGGAPRHDSGPPVCCRTNPDAAPEGCVCEPAKLDIVMVTGDTCSVSTTVNGQAIAFTGIVVPTCQ
jgi:hypothetical protein